MCKKEIVMRILHCSRRVFERWRPCVRACVRRRAVGVYRTTIGCLGTNTDSGSLGES